MERYRKLIESIRLFGAAVIAILMTIGWLSIVSGFIIALILGLIDQIFIKPKLKSKEKNGLIKAYFLGFFISPFFCFCIN